MSNELSTLSLIPGSQRKRFRLGRGIGSGNGKTAGRGTKGQNSRSGSNRSPGFEGGQTPIQRRLPKRGFNNPFATHWEVVNLMEFERLGNVEVIELELMISAGLVTGKYPVKILAKGDISRAYTVKAHGFSAQAVAKIEACGGKVEVI